MVCFVYLSVAGWVHFGVFWGDYRVNCLVSNGMVWGEELQLG